MFVYALAFFENVGFTISILHLKLLFCFLRMVSVSCTDISFLVCGLVPLTDWQSSQKTTH